MKSYLFLVILLGFIFNSCSEKQRAGWENRIEKIAGQEEPSAAQSNRSDSSTIVLEEQGRHFIDLQLELISLKTIVDIIEAPAVIVPHPDHVVAIKAPLAGRITALSAQLGSRVKANSIVAVIEDPQNLGQRLAIRTPINGVVSSRLVSKNEWIDSGETLMTIIDFGTLQAIIQLYPNGLEKVVPGQIVKFYGNGWTTQSRINFISPTGNPDTGTIEARADIDNSRWKIKANLLLQAQIIVGEKKALVVPKTVMVPEEDHYIIFVQQGEGFEKRVIEVGIHDGDLVEVVKGLKEGEVVVTRGAYQLKNLSFSASVPMVEED